MKKLIALAALGVSMLIAPSAFAYKVKSGDTMSEIAEDHKITLHELSKANPQIKNIDLIYVDQIINIPGEKEQTNKVQTKVENTNNSSYKTMTVEATAYTAYCKGCSGITAIGIDLRSNPNQKVIAVDPKVIPLGAKVYVEGYGYAIAGDTGGAIKGNKIDLFIPNLSEALEFGRRNIQIKVYD